jgi:hypothetical protein
MNGFELNDQLPESYLKKAAESGIHGRELRGDLKSHPHRQGEDIQTEAERVVNYLKKTVFPKVSGRD